MDQSDHHVLVENGVIFINNRLSYVGQDCQQIPPMLIQQYGSKVHILDLSFNCLTSLFGVEKFMNLQELVLDNNNITDTFNIPELPYLHTLSLNKNNISNLEILLNKLSKKVPSLRYLSLLGNVACPNQLSHADHDEEDYQRYRYYVLHHLPHLQFLDSSRVSSGERQEAASRGRFMRVVRPISQVYYSDSPSLPGYSPLPHSSREIGEHQGAYGKCRYSYSGKHSEGNRFIQNNDL